MSGGGGVESAGSGSSVGQDERPLGRSVARSVVVVSTIAGVLAFHVGRVDGA